GADLVSSQLPDRRPPCTAARRWLLNSRRPAGTSMPTPPGGRRTRRTPDRRREPVGRGRPCVFPVARPASALHRSAALAAELAAARRYIDANPARWQEDPENA